MSIATEQCSYQAYVEAVRTHPDCEQLAEDLARARSALQLAWLRKLFMSAP